MESETLVLVVDDSLDSRVCVQRILEDAGFRVAMAEDGESALDILSREQVDLILADIAMPRMNGYQLFEKVTEDPAWVAVPFIFLSGRALDSDVRYAKLMGVDDYITKPFRAKELLTTVRGRLKRAEMLQRATRPTTRNKQSDERGLVYGSLFIDPASYRVAMDGEDVALSSREFRLLRCLAENRGRVVPLQEIVKATHGLETDYQDAGSLIRPLVRSVRRKLGYSPGEWGCIRSVRGVGYQMVVADA
jgi:DNA-binding response OmpR family regulator